MLNALGNFLYIASFILAASSPFQPLALMWRSLVASVFASIAARLIRGGVHWSDQGVGHAIGLALLFWFVLLLVIALGLRVSWALAAKKLTKDAPSVREPDANSYLRVDQAIAVLAGGTAGLGFVLGLSVALGGISGGILLDLCIALVATVIAVLLLIRRRTPVQLAGFAFTIVVAGVSFAGSLQTWRIIDGAEAMAVGQPWCLVMPSAGKNVSMTRELGFFSLPKGGIRSHLVLLVEDGTLRRKAHWSIRQQRFIEGISDFSLPQCQPQTHVEGL
jgi:hypothetical protein